MKDTATCGREQILQLLSTYKRLAVRDKRHRIAKFYNAARIGDVKQFLNQGEEPDMKNFRRKPTL
jgi:hypothetical protein